MHLRKAAGLLGIIAISLFLFSNASLSITGLVTGNELSTIKIETNVPEGSIIGPSDVSEPIIVQIKNGDVSVSSTVSTVHTRIDNELISDSFVRQGETIWLDRTRAAPFVESGAHTLTIEIEMNGGKKIIHEQTFEVDYTLPRVTIHAQSPESAVFSIEDNESLIQTENISTYYVGANGDVSWGNDSVLRCQSISEKKADCELAPHTPIDDWVVLYQDAAVNKGSVSFGALSVDELQLKAAERNMEMVRERAQKARENNAITLQAGGTCTNPKIDYFIFHTTGDFPNANWTLQKKINFALAAKQDIQDIYDDGLAQKGFSAVPLGVGRIVVLVKEGTSLTGITGHDEVITIPNSMLPTSPNGPPRCDNPYKVCFEWGNLGGAINAPAFQAIMTTKDSSNIGLIEQTKKYPNNVLMIILDGKLNATAQAHAFSGSAYIDFTQMYRGVNLPYQTDFSRVVAHELGHLLGMDDLDIVQNQLMTASASGTFATDMDFHTAARIKTILCTPKQKPASLGIVETAASYGTSGYGNYLLGRETGDLEECEVNYAGVIDPANFPTATHQDYYCVATKYDGGIIDPPVAVTNQAGPNNVALIKTQYPGVIIKACQGPSTPTPGICKPVGGSGIPGSGKCTGPACAAEIRPKQPTTPASDTVTPYDPTHCNNFKPGDGTPPSLCPANATCPPNMKCAAQGHDCRCIPNDVIFCGNGFVERGEACDPPGSVCNGFCMGGAWMTAYCSSSCQCEFPAGPTPNELLCQPNAG